MVLPEPDMKYRKAFFSQNVVSLLPLTLVLAGWAFYMTYAGNWYLFNENWFMSLTMVFGSFIAGASSEGGGAVAFPVMTLIFEIQPPVARNFSLAIQSIGMTAASFLIIRNRYPVEYRYLIPVSIGGIAGMVLGTLVLVPVIHGPYLKMLFVSFWLSFGLVLYYLNHIDKRIVSDRLPSLSRYGSASLVIVGFLGNT